MIGCTVRVALQKGTHARGRPLGGSTRFKVLYGPASRGMHTGN